MGPSMVTADMTTGFAANVGILSVFSRADSVPADGTMGESDVVFAELE